MTVLSSMTQQQLFKWLYKTHRGDSSIKMMACCECQQYIMFHDERIPNIGIRVLFPGKQEYMQLDLEINQAGLVNLNQLVEVIWTNFPMDSNTLYFYFDYSRAAFEHFNQEKLNKVHFTTLISDKNHIVFKCEPRLSDQILANPPRNHEETRVKRSRERLIQQAFLLVEQWRHFYRQGFISEEGTCMKINLQQSAEIVGVPRKTLQDYFLLLRMGLSLQFDFKTNRRERMGVLRLYVRQRGKMKSTSNKEVGQKQLFQQLRLSLLGMKNNEQQIFDILKSNPYYSSNSSDEYMIFQA